MKIIISVLLSASLSFASFIGGGNKKSDNDLINYYNDGVYDTISQINKEIEEGVNKEELKNIQGKIAVLTPLQNISTVDLIFYKTTAAKINLFNATTVIDESGTPYMLWDLKQREIDSQFIIQKLTERNIPVTSRAVSSDSKFFREPMLIKDFIDKVKHNIKNVDTKVAVVEKNIYTKEKITAFPPVEVEEKIVYEQPIPKNRETEQNKIDKAPRYNEVSFAANTQTASRNLRIGTGGALYYKISKVQKGAKLENFVLSNVRVEDNDLHTNHFITYEEDPLKKEYLLFMNKKPIKKVETTAITPVPQKVQEKEKNSSKFKCNFQNIKTAISKDGKAIKIDSANLFYNKVVTLDAVKKIDSNYLMTNTIGLPEILLSEKYLNNSNYCSKVN